MSDPETREADLRRLIAAGPPAASGPLSRAVRRLWRRVGGAQTAHRQTIDRGLLELLAGQRETLVGTTSEIAELRAELAGIRDAAMTLSAEFRGMHGWVQRIDGEVGGGREWLQGVSDQTDELGRSLGTIAAGQESLCREVAALARRSPAAVPLEGEGRLLLERFESPLGTEVLGIRAPAGRAGAHAEVYPQFEDFFRGSEAAIRGRQLAHAPLLEAHAPVLDVGCGRGEMLDLLRERGIAAEGIDSDPGMVERCRAKGLEHVLVGDGVEYLESVPQGTLGAVFSAQVIEHLPYAVLLRFLRAARLALAPEGILVMETVNPHNPQALKHFWIDPTHQHPLFPEVIVALCALIGFSSAYIWFPHGSGDIDRDRFEQPDYAVVAQSPPAPGGAPQPS